ncbi:MAG: ribosome silencing factor [Atopobiaceae bacterium]|nr:ribosome silencing factor [Atopobiaceae bacterium]
MAVTPLELAKVAATAADDKKATDILVLDLTDKSDVCDYFVICTVANNPMMDAVVEAVEEKVRINCDEKPLSVEGRAGATWVLVDYGAVVLHVFREESREFYRLERLWGDAPHVHLELEGATPEDQWVTVGEQPADMPM